MATAATTMCTDNCTNTGVLYEFTTDEIWARWYAIAYYFEYQPWIFSLIGSTMVGLSGILPLYVIPIDEGADLKNGAGAGTLKILLSFAVGGLLGDVFLHLLPEAWASKALNIAQSDGQRPMACGLWVLTGFLIFIIAEKMFIGGVEDDQEAEENHDDTRSTDEINDKYFNNNVHKELDNNNCPTSNGIAGSNNHSSKLKYTNSSLEYAESSMMNKSRLNEMNNGYSIQTITTTKRKNGFTKNSSNANDINLAEKERDSRSSHIPNLPNGFATFSSNLNNHQVFDGKNRKKCAKLDEKMCSNMIGNEKPKGKHITGYLNLMANCIDNFTHGLAVGGSFLVSFRLGALTTFAILIHEIPHEVGDFAILLKSGFSRWDAARAQLLTAGGGIFGALTAVMCSGSGIESRTSWILPFTAGGFLHIGMVTVLPELLKETNPKESMKQLGALLSGITVMAILTILCD